MTSASDTRKCPACDKPMDPHTVGVVPLDMCGHCGGVWFDCGEFGKMTAGGVAAIRAVEAQEPPTFEPYEHHEVMGCPKCESSMENYRYAGSTDILLHRCADCGGIFASPESLQKLDLREQERRNGKKPGQMSAQLTEQVAILDSMTAANVYKTNLANWVFSLEMSGRPRPW